MIRYIIAFISCAAASFLIHIWMNRFKWEEISRINKKIIASDELIINLINFLERNQSIMNRWEMKGLMNIRDEILCKRDINIKDNLFDIKTVKGKEN